jgi:hypothetical protein
MPRDGHFELQSDSRIFATNQPNKFKEFCAGWNQVTSHFGKFMTCSQEVW